MRAHFWIGHTWSDLSEYIQMLITHFVEDLRRPKRLLTSVEMECGVGNGSQEIKNSMRRAIASIPRFCRLV